MAGKRWMKTRPACAAFAALAWTLLGFVFALPDLSAAAVISLTFAQSL
jgi:hypothetical protein